MQSIRCFIVHGHDAALKFELKDYLQNTLGLPEPIILEQQPDGGATIIEKFEEYAAEVDAALVLMTPDDLGGSISGGSATRARQNVVFELGYFLGKFGRRSGRVLLLHKGVADLASDLTGVIYIDVSGGVLSAGERIRRNLAVIGERLG